MLRIDLQTVMEARSLTARQVDAEASLARGVTEKLLARSGDQTNRIIRLKTLGRLASALDIGLAPPPPIPRPANTPSGPVPPLLCWNPNRTLRWNVGDAHATPDHVLGYWESIPYELFVATGKYQNTIYPICEGRTERVALDVLAAIALATNAPVGLSPSGSVDVGFLLRWEPPFAAIPHVLEIQSQITHQGAQCRVVERGVRCGEQPVAHDLCLNHYMQWRGGKPIEEMRIAHRKAPEQCSWIGPNGESCDRTASVSGLCYTHYRMRQRAKRQAKSETPSGDPRKDAP